MSKHDRRGRDGLRDAAAALCSIALHGVVLATGYALVRPLGPGDADSAAGWGDAVDVDLLVGGGAAEGGAEVDAHPTPGQSQPRADVAVSRVPRAHPRREVRATSDDGGIDARAAAHASADLGAVHSNRARAGTGATGSAAAGGGLQCHDPIAGTWTATFPGPDSRTNDMILRLHRMSEDLVGEAVVTVSASPARPDAPNPPCARDWAYRVRMRFRGWIHGRTVSFGADSFEYERIECSADGYNPDHFTGSLTSEKDIMDVVDNDGGFAHDLPVRFRRIMCESREQ